MYDDLSLSDNADYRPRFHFADAFPRFLYAAVTLETVALGKPNDVAVLVTDDSAKRSVLFQHRTSLPFSDTFTRAVTQHCH
jgi:hypothetical protein